MLGNGPTGRRFGSCATTALFPHQKKEEWWKKKKGSLKRDMTVFPRAMQDRTAPTFQCPQPGRWRRWEGSPQHPRVQ